MNLEILSPEVQTYINSHLQADVNKIALKKSPFNNVSAAEIAGQVAAKKKAAHKLPTWYQAEKIYYPPLLSIEQTSSEPTAHYKSKLALGGTLIDLTAGFGVDSFYFAQENEYVVSCELNVSLSAISAHNAKILGVRNIRFETGDGLTFVEQTKEHFDTIYLDPARRNGSSKVFQLRDCTPNVVEHLPLLRSKSNRIMIKTAPLLDLNAGLEDLQNVSEIHILSVKNECKELLWIIDKGHFGATKVVCATLNEQIKYFTFQRTESQVNGEYISGVPSGYLYEPDAALLKSGAFQLIGKRYGLKKLHLHTHLYVAELVLSEFPGRIFQIDSVFQLNELKKSGNLIGNVIVRNFPERAENLVKKYKIQPDHNQFVIFSQIEKGFVAIKAKILQHY